MACSKYTPQSYTFYSQKFLQTNISGHTPPLHEIIRNLKRGSRVKVHHGMDLRKIMEKRASQCIGFTT